MAAAPGPGSRSPGASGAHFEDALFVSAKRGWVGGYIGIWARTGAQYVTPPVEPRRASPVGWFRGSSLRSSHLNQRRTRPAG